MPVNLVAGTKAKVTATFTDDEDAIGDPTTIVAKVRAPSGGISSYTYGTHPELTRSSLGVYVLEVVLSSSGRWQVRFEGTGAIVAAQEATIEVAASQFF